MGASADRCHALLLNPVARQAFLLHNRRQRRIWYDGRLGRRWNCWVGDFNRILLSRRRRPNWYRYWAVHSDSAASPFRSLHVRVGHIRHGCLDRHVDY